MSRVVYGEFDFNIILIEGIAGSRVWRGSLNRGEIMKHVEGVKNITCGELFTVSAKPFTS